MYLYVLSLPLRTSIDTLSTNLPAYNQCDTITSTAQHRTLCIRYIYYLQYKLYCSRLIRCHATRHATWLVCSVLPSTLHFYSVPSSLTVSSLLFYSILWIFKIVIIVNSFRIRSKIAVLINIWCARALSTQLFCVHLNSANDAFVFLF